MAKKKTKAKTKTKSKTKGKARAKIKVRSTKDSKKKRSNPSTSNLESARSTGGSPKPFAGSRVGKGLLYLLGLTSFSFFTVEGILRMKGEGPSVPYKPNVVRVEPVHRLYEPHPRLGYVSIPGEHTILLDSGLQWRSTVLPNHNRATHPHYEKRVARPSIWLMGCSETYGWSVNDEQTFPWLVQKNLPEYEILNFGTPGYGTLQSLYQFEESLFSEQRPEVVVVFFASFHRWRNVFAARIRKIVSVWNKLGPVSIPYALLGAKGELLEYQAPPDYRPLPGTFTFALMNRLDWNRVTYLEKGIKPYETTLAILRKFDRVTKRAGVKLVVATLDKKEPVPRLLNQLKRDGIAVLPIGMDLMKQENMNLPHDRHRSPMANEIIADKVVRELKKSKLIR